MATVVINSDSSLQSCIGLLREMFSECKYIKVSARAGMDRSPDQNAISHAWYGQLARELPEDDALGWKCFCKLNFGVPILRAEDAAFKESYDKTVKNSLSYEMKLELMKWFSVTSEMTKSQLSKYLEAMQVYFISRNVVLSFPDAAA